MRIPRQTPAGFTLIELLVVIVIIGVLAALGFPVFSKVRRTAARTECISQIRQIGIALNLFANENNDFYPEGWDPVKKETFAAKLKDYSQTDLRQRKTIFVSPLAEPITANDNLPYNITYGMHGLLGLEMNDPAKPNRMRVQRPSQIILAANTVQVPGNFNRSSCTIYSPSELYWVDCNYPLDQPIPVQDSDGNLAYPDSKVDCVFVDGHVAAMMRGQVTWGNLLPAR